MVVAAAAAVVAVADAAVVEAKIDPMTMMKPVAKINEASKKNAAAKTNTRFGLGFRNELALFIDRAEDIAFVEILAEDYQKPTDIPQALKNLSARGIEIIPHCTSLSLGSVELPDTKMLTHLDTLARYFSSPFVSDHIALVRSVDLESGHLLPVPRNTQMLSLLTRNIVSAREKLSVPLVLENIATTFECPGNVMDEAQFVSTLLSITDCRLLLDISNLFANSHNHKFDAVALLKRYPLERLEYVHLAGGMFKQGLYHDTHCHPLLNQSLELLRTLSSMVSIPRVMLERDDNFPAPEEISLELDAIKNACYRGAEDRLFDDGDCGEKSAVEIVNFETNENFELGLEDLEQIKSEQEELLHALLIDAEMTPSGYDKELVAGAHQSLIRKRLRTMKRACPYLQELFDGSGEEFNLDAALKSFYLHSPSPSPRGPFVDAMAFIVFLNEQGVRGQFSAAFGRIKRQDVEMAQNVVSDCASGNLGIGERVRKALVRFQGIFGANR